MHAWLDETCGAEGHRWRYRRPAGTTGSSTMPFALYSLEDAAFAHAFVARFCCGYRVETIAGAFALRSAHGQRGARLRSWWIFLFMVRSNDYAFCRGAVERYGTPTAWRCGFCAANIKERGLAADGERRSGESAPKARGMERPAPLPRWVTAGSNTLAPAGRGKAAIAPPLQGGCAAKSHPAATKALRKAAAQSPTARRAVAIKRP